MSNSTHLLEVLDLHTSFNIPSGEVRSVNGVSFTLDKGQVLGIVGESGSGKSVTAYSIMQILENPGRVIGGSIKFKGQEMLNIPNHQLQKIRGEKVSIIFQDAMTSLNPVWSVGNQLIEAIKIHKDAPIYQEKRIAMEEAKQAYLDAKRQRLSKEEITEVKNNYLLAKQAYKNFPKDRALEMLELVGINEPEKRLKQYPFEFSGGMLQRIMIAMALICEPELIIADEPTTALDVTIQAQILELLINIQKKMGMGIIIITHDLGVVAQICDHVNVMYAGRIVEQGTVNDIFYNPKHEYTKGLMNSIPKMDVKTDKLQPIAGNPVDVFCLPQGCSFVPRCNKCMKVCLTKYPAYINVDNHHQTACFQFAKELLEEGKITDKEFDEYISRCQEGNRAFNPITRLDIEKAYQNYLDLKQDYVTKIKNNEDLSDDEIDILKFRVNEGKRNLARAKNDFKIARRTKKYSRKEKMSIDRNDVRKKIGYHKKQIGVLSADSSFDLTKFEEYLSKLVISTTLPNFDLTTADVTEAKVKLQTAKKESHANFETRYDKIAAKVAIDEAKDNYLKLKSDLKWAKYVDKKLRHFKPKLTRIFNKTKVKIEKQLNLGGNEDVK